ncbi:MAG: hypothetical protein ACFE8U_17900, partial [Candidatus Hermodarchaeota archaeon]
MNRKGRLIFFLFNLIALTTLFMINNAIAEPTQIEETDAELFLELWYDKEPVMNEPTWIDCYVEAATDVTFSLELRVENSTHSLVLYHNPSITLIYNSNQQWFDCSVKITFNKTEQWNIRLAATTTVKVYDVTGQLEVSPFQLSIYEMYKAIAYNPTEIEIYIGYEDNIPNKNITVEVLLDDSNINFPGTNISIYNKPHVFASGPVSFFDTFYYPFDNIGYYVLWLNVTDLDTNQQWFTWNSIYVHSINATIYQESQLFVGNITKIEIELNYYGPFEIFADAFLYIIDYYHFDKEESYSYEWKGIKLNATHPRFNDSIFLSFEEHGEYDVWLDVFDETNDEYISDWCYFTVWNEVDLRIDQPMEIWPGEGDDYSADFSIYYFRSETVTVDIEVFLDGSIIHYEYGVEFPGQTPYTFNYFPWGYNINAYPILNLGYHEVTLRVYIIETTEEFTEHRWFYARGADTAPPVFREISGLTNGATYSNVITITANVTDDQSYIYYVDLIIKNENYTGTYHFGIETYQYKFKVFYFCYATLKLDTARIYDGKYDVTLEAGDEEGHTGSETFSVIFENGYI